MILEKLFQSQMVLKDRIEKEHPVEKYEDRFSKRVLSLLVELGECTNEQRSWKYWSHDQEPRTKEKCPYCNGNGYIPWYQGSVEHGNLVECQDVCAYCDGLGMDDSQNPLLEEYVDGLHFVLELGLDMHIDQSYDFQPDCRRDVVGHLLYLFDVISYFRNFKSSRNYLKIITAYLGLGELLGFTPEQIEKAYFLKNEINHIRQDGGY